MENSFDEDTYNPWEQESLPEDAPSWAVQLWTKMQDIEENNTRDSFKDTNYVDFKSFMEVREELNALKLSHAILKVDFKNLQEKVVNLEAHSRRDNLLFDGIPEEAKEGPVDCERKVLKVVSTLGLPTDEIKISRAHRIGQQKADKPRSVVAKFHFYGDRSKIYKNRKLLKERPVYGSKVFINEDFPETIMKRRKVLLPIYRNAIKMEAYKGKCRMTLDRLVINSVSYTIDDLHKLPADLNPATLSEKSTDNVTVFFGQHTPMSNFHPSSFIHEGMSYNCGEQFIQTSKAELFDDESTAGAILQTNSPHRQKFLGSKVRNFDNKIWRESAHNCIKEGLREKFIQNEHLRSHLLSTGKRTLGEASKDKLWGIGYTLKDEEALDVSKWSGFNLLGKVLMELRSELHD